MTVSGTGDPGLRLRIAAAYATIYLVWGSTFLAIRIGVRDLPPLFARFYDDPAQRKCPVCGVVHPGKAAASGVALRSL